MVYGTIISKWNSLVKNRAEEQIAKQNANYKVKTHLETIVSVWLGKDFLVPLENSHASLAWEQSCQSRLCTIVPVSLENNCTSVIWEQSCLCYLERVVPESLENNCASLTKKKGCQCHLGIVAPVSLENNHASLTWVQLWQCHLRTLVPVSLENHCASVPWKKLCQCDLETIVPVSFGNNCARVNCDNCSSVAWEQSRHSHLGIIVPVSLRIFCASVTFRAHILVKHFRFIDFFYRNISFRIIVKKTCIFLSQKHTLSSFFLVASVCFFLCFCVKFWDKENSIDPKLILRKLFVWPSGRYMNVFLHSV